MTTLAHPTPSAAAAGARPFPSIDLPSGPPPQAAAAAAEPAPRKTGLLTWLLAGTAAAGVLGMIGTGLVATLSRAGHPVPPPADWLGVPQAVSPQQPPGQPSQPVPAPPPSLSAPATPGTRPSQVPASAVPVPTPTPTPTPRSNADDLRALKQAGPYAQPAPFRPAAAPAPAPLPTMQETPANPSAAWQPDTKAAPAPAAGPASVAGTPNPDPAAGPSPQDLITMVTALAEDIAQERKDDAELRGQIAGLLHDTDQRLSEFDRRLTVAEGGTAPAYATARSERALSRPALASAGALPALRTALAATPPPGGRRYEIRAASPGVAVLGTLDGTPSVVEVAVGDQVAGYGRVNAIAQKGSAWAVQCDRGTIQ